MWKRLLLIRGAEVIVFAALASVPLVVSNTFALGLLTLLAIYGILLIGLDVTLGYLGQINLAQSAFLGIGAYTAALCVFHLGFTMLESLAAASLVGLVIGGILAFLMVRTDLPGRAWIEPMLLIPVFVSPMVLAFGYVVAVGPVGFYSVWVKNIIGMVPWNIYSLAHTE